MNKYQYFSLLYDDLTEDMDYTPWIELVKKYKGSLLDIGCGSGTLLISLNQLGYDCTGLDLSNEMLEIARKKIIMNHLSINIIEANMINFDLRKRFDIITCFFDTLNHLSTEEEVVQSINLMSKHLNEDGVILIDLFTKEKMSDIDNEEFIFDELTYNAVWKMKTKNNNIIHNLEFLVGDNIIKEQYIETYFDIKKILPKTLTIINETPIIVDDTYERIIYSIKKL